MIPDPNYWFYDSFDGVRIPHAITVDAINYYSNIIDLLNASSDSLIYKAEVIYYNS